jgi:hypothetical protein
MLTLLQKADLITDLLSWAKTQNCLDPTFAADSLTKQMSLATLMPELRRTVLAKLGKKNR